MGKIKIFQVDDHVALRDGLGALLERNEKFEITGSASDGVEAIEAFTNGAPADVMLLDVSMPRMNGYEVAERMKEIAPAVKIFFLTMLDSDFTVMKALTLGAKGIAKKDIATAALYEAIELIAAGGYYYCPTTNEKLAGIFTHGTKTPLLQMELFTPQEIEFIRYSGEDIGYKEISAKMAISPNAAEYLKKSVFDKAEVKTRNALVLYAVRNGLLHY